MALARDICSICCYLFFGAVVLLGGFWVAWWFLGWFFAYLLLLPVLRPCSL